MISLTGSTHWLCLPRLATRISSIALTSTWETPRFPSSLLLDEQDPTHRVGASTTPAAAPANAGAHQPDLSWANHDPRVGPQNHESTVCPREAQEPFWKATPYTTCSSFALWPSHTPWRSSPLNPTLSALTSSTPLPRPKRLPPCKPCFARCTSTDTLPPSPPGITLARHYHTLPSTPSVHCQKQIVRKSSTQHSKLNTRATSTTMTSST